MEATGVYHLDLAVALHNAQDIEVMVVNPKAAKHFADATMTRTKTDALDEANNNRADGSQNPDNQTTEDKFNSQITIEKQIKGSPIPLEISLNQQKHRLYRQY